MICVALSAFPIILELLWSPLHSQDPRFRDSQFSPNLHAISSTLQVPLPYQRLPGIRLSTRVKEQRDTRHSPWYHMIDGGALTTLLSTQPLHSIPRTRKVCLRSLSRFLFCCIHYMSVTIQSICHCRPLLSLSLECYFAYRRLIYLIIHLDLTIIRLRYMVLPLSAIWNFFFYPFFPY